MNESNIYPRTGDRQTVYLKHAVKAPSIIVGDYTIHRCLRSAGKTSEPGTEA